MDFWKLLRAKRNAYLKETDYLMLGDVPIDTTLRAKYKEYRQYLRNLPKMYNDDNISTAKVKTFKEWQEFRANGTY